MFEFIVEPERKVKVLCQADVVVCGGGTAGVAAAICAGRLGLEVVMIENSAMPGGMITHCIGGIQDCATKGGFVRELMTWLRQEGYNETRYENMMRKYNRHYVPQYFDRLLENAGVRPLYLARCVDVIKEDDQLHGVIVESKSGRRAVLASIIIDATGDGDIAVQAGADYKTGREEDNACQAISLPVIIQEYGGQFIPKGTFGAMLTELEEKLDQANVFPYKRARLNSMPATKYSTSWSSHVYGYNPTDAEELSQALIELRRQAFEAFVQLKDNFDEFKEANFGPMASIPGIRESRRIECDEMITIDDLLSGRKRDDGIFTVKQAIDIHQRTSQDPCIFLQKVLPYHVPYGALLPRGIDDFLVVGRCIGGDHEALGSYRISADCLAMGEAAAIASSIALEKRCQVRSVPADMIANRMKERGYEL